MMNTKNIEIIEAAINENDVVVPEDYIASRHPELLTRKTPVKPENSKAIILTFANAAESEDLKLALQQLANSNSSNQELFLASSTINLDELLGAQLKLNCKEWTTIIETITVPVKTVVSEWVCKMLPPELQPTCKEVLKTVIEYVSKEVIKKVCAD
ncbi:hypothetical protein ACFQ3S_17940 [Mucilaginibacter terrae]|uniref:hypothetical protein n=1 Tax=Mucilaginibacter terrae TaxID=1955052 RepID=UPI00362501C5